MSIAKCPEPTELDPVVIEYQKTIQRVREDGESFLANWIAGMKRPSVTRKLRALRDSHPCPDSEYPLKQPHADAE